MQNKNVVIGIVVVLLLVAGYLAINNKKGADMNNEEKVELNTNTQEQATTVNDDAGTEAKVLGVEKSFVVTGSNFKFLPATINVNKGDTVKITFKNSDGFHDFKIDELNVATEKIKAGAEQTVTFVADKAGSFEYYCSVGTHRAMGMKGTLIVK
jgi:plastocyanin